MDKRIDLSRTVYELCKKYPEIIEILVDLGFQEIRKAGMLQTAGRFMTIPKGAAMKNIRMERIKECFMEQGFQIEEEGLK